MRLKNKVAIITGAGQGIGQATALKFAREGARVAVCDINREGVDSTLALVVAEGGEALGVGCDVLDRASLEAAAEKILKAFGRVDILVNGAGGNKPQATTGADTAFFDLPADALRWVFDLNLMGVVLPSQVFGRLMAGQKRGVILNIASMNAIRPLTRIPAYSAAKAGVANFPQWLAVHMAQEYSPEIRVNAIAPGFFLTDQNRFLLTDKSSGELTPRGRTILEHTPMKRFGAPEDLMGAMLWLLSPASAFVTGIIVPVDGGYSAFGGV